MLNRNAFDNLQLLDFTQEDDNLIAFPYRDSLEDLRISVTFDNFKKSGQCGQNKLKSIRAPKGKSLELQGPKLVSSSRTNSRAVERSEYATTVTKGKKSNLIKMKPTTSPSSRTSSASCFKTPSNASGKIIEEKALTDQYATRSSARKIRSSGLRIPSSAVIRSNVKKDLSGEDSRKRVGASCTKIKTSEQIRKRISRNRVNIVRKSEKDDKKQDESDHCLLQESRKENMCNFEDQVNGLSRKMKVNNLDMKLTEIKGQQDCVNTGQLSFRSSGAHTTPCSRTPFADSKKINIRRKINPQNTKATKSPPSVLSPLSSSNTSPTCSFHEAITASDFHTPARDSCRYATRSSIKKITFSGLRMPSPRLGFFD